ncbi:lipase family protein [Emticicia soli]|uniref:Lipase family protein n=1 Tax=Emticicia soli TaxID=2027878 RepID=A0ABW5J458_9BACT
MPSKKNILSIFLLVFIISANAFGQILKPGFDKAEYIETLKINQKVHIALSKWTNPSDVPDPQDHRFVYRSPVVAFDNIWDLWINKTKPVAVISVQGSIQTEASFLANLYAAMIPAKGELQLDKNFKFNYTLSNNPKAAVHVGWFVAMAYLSKTIKPKIDSCYKTGIKDFILTGHSQGGGITFLLNSYLENLKAENKLPADIRFKTYCSAGPKPGNLFYAYDYENMTQGGWAYNVVNAADWVPDVPFSVQTVNDFTAVNPFYGAKAMIKKQKFPKNLALKHIYKQMSKPSLKAQKNYQRYLGKMVSMAVRKQIPDFVTPQYYESNYYVRTGNTIVLVPDDEYFKLYSNAPENPNIWQHHLPKQYLYLVDKLKL